SDASVTRENPVHPGGSALRPAIASGGIDTHKCDCGTIPSRAGNNVWLETYPVRLNAPMAIATSIFIIVLLILANGFFSMTEFALISARTVRLQKRAADGDTGAAIALELAEDPTPFLSTIQIGITVIGILAGAFGGATLAGPVAEIFAEIPLIAPYSGPLAVATVVVAITYLTLVIGELAPKRVAMVNAEGI